MENHEFTDITMLVPLIFIAAVSLYRIARYHYLTQKRAARRNKHSRRHYGSISDRILQVFFNVSPSKQDVKL